MRHFCASTLVGGVALLASTVGFAATDGQSLPSPSMMNKAGWYLELGGSYQKPTDSDLSNSAFANLGIQTLSPSGATNTNRTEKLKTGYLWGGRATIGYRMPDSPYAVNLSFNGSFGNRQKGVGVLPTTKSSFSTLTSFFPIPTVLNNIIPGTKILLNNASAKLQTNYFTVDLVGKRIINLPYQIKLMPYAGVRFMYLNEKYTLDGNSNFVSPVNPNLTVDFSGNWTYNTKFYGIGPHVGTKLLLPLISDFSFFVDGHASLLMGTAENNLNLYEKFKLTPEPVGMGTVTSTINYPGDRNTRFVPGVGGSVGFAYFAPISETTSVGIKLGYQGDFYYHAVDNRAFKQTQTLLLTPSAMTTENLSNFSNFKIYGPFASLVLKG